MASMVPTTQMGARRPPPAPRPGTGPLPYLWLCGPEALASIPSQSPRSAPPSSRQAVEESEALEMKCAQRGDVICPRPHS